MLLHAFVPGSRANGPGLRAVVFFQGCVLQCSGCWNPETHRFRGLDVPVSLEP
jgi:anaerobic ribonucleoside-triphosphate reductase activating protein